ncbi:hypothetical protein MMC26_007310 [Xylographa opegraphella]|nr:hypothetical protein [Xylographa opegraphella]
MATGLAGLGTVAATVKGAAATPSDVLATTNYPIPRADSPSPFNPLPQTTTTHQSPHLNPYPLLPHNDKAPHIQPWVPINSPKGQKFIREHNLPGLTGKPYEKRPKSVPSSRRNTINPEPSPQGTKTASRKYAQQGRHIFPIYTFPAPQRYHFRPASRQHQSL